MKTCSALLINYRDQFPQEACSTDHSQTGSGLTDQPETASLSLRLPVHCQADCLCDCGLSSFRRSCQGPSSIPVNLKMKKPTLFGTSVAAVITVCLYLTQYVDGTTYGVPDPEIDVIEVFIQILAYTNASTASIYSDSLFATARM